MNPTDDKTESTLIRERDRYEFASTVFAWVIVIGLLVEGVFILRDHPFWPDAIKGLTSTFLISLGVAGEIIFGGRSGKRAETLRHLSEIKVAAANERAAQANLRLEELRVRLTPKFVGPKLTAALLGLPPGNAII